MQRLPMWLVAIALLLASLGIAPEAARGSDFEQVVQEVSMEIRCPICKGLAAWESDTAPAREIVADVRERLAKGESKAQILDAYAEMYGPWILMRPPRRGFSLSAYLLPVVVLVAGASLIAVALRRSRRRRDSEPSDPVAPEQGDAEYRDRVQEILRDNL